MPTFTHSGINFHYDSVGSGPPVVVCHGLTGDMLAPKELVGDLPGYRLIAWDARAHGLTQPLGDTTDLSFAEMAHDLSALLDHLEISRAIVGGISMGAGIAARFAMDSSDRVRGLVMIRPAWLDARFPANLQLPVLVARLFDEHGPSGWQSAFDRHPLVQGIHAKDPRLISTMRQQLDTPLAIERRARLTRIPGDSPLIDWSEVACLSFPALVIGSESDWLHPLDFAETWASRLPNSYFRRATSKSIDLQQHNQDVRKHLREFLLMLDPIVP